VAMARLNRIAGEAGSVRAGAAFSVPVPGGAIVARAEDGGNCFNLNALAVRSPEGAFAPEPQMIDQFARLLALHGVPDQDAVRMAGRVAARLVSSRTLFVDAREAREAAMIGDAVFLRLSPLLCALPVTAPMLYNVNTLRPDQAALVAALLPRGADLQTVARALAARPAQGFAQPADLSAAAAGQLGTRTDWFVLDLDARLGDAGMAERVLIDARARPVRLVRRVYGDPDAQR